MVKFLAQTHVFFLVSIQALASKTLDQASAQFAASALVTTDQLLAFKSKEELVLASGVNGVLAGAGDYFIDPASLVRFSNLPRAEKENICRMSLFLLV